MKRYNVLMDAYNDATVDVPALVERLLDEALDMRLPWICLADGASRLRFMRRLREELASPATDGEGSEL